MKKVLIYVLSCNSGIYHTLTCASLNTWDSIPVCGVGTVFYCGSGDSVNNSKVKSFDVDDGLMGISFKCVKAYDWALCNMQWDYMARVNASCYVHKERLLHYVQGLKENGVLIGRLAKHGEHTFLIGGMQFILSRDVVEKIVENSSMFGNGPAEDVRMSALASKIGIELNPNGCGCAVRKTSDKYDYMEFKNGSSNRGGSVDVSDILNLGHHFYRINQAPNRDLDIEVMNDMFSHQIAAKNE